MNLKILKEIFAKQSPLTGAQFEASYRTHPDVNAMNLPLVQIKFMGMAGTRRLTPFVQKNIVRKYIPSNSRKPVYELVDKAQPILA